jgi:hypothetical protein
MRAHRILFVLTALLLATTAGAQRAPSHTPVATLPTAAAAAWNGTPSKWGGSPPASSRENDRGQPGYAGQTGAYIPVAVAAPYPVAAPVDTACTRAPQASVEMPVVTTHREERQLTTIEVYRLQARFQKP